MASDSYEQFKDVPCRCGHPVSDHHVSWFPGGSMLVEECEAEGVTWGHCQHFHPERIARDSEVSE